MMETDELHAYTTSLVPTRLKRRPALACEQCRRRKIKCDRSTPCQQCIKSNTRGCLYVHDTRTALKKAPFEAADIQFSVFDQTSCALPQPRCRSPMGISPSDTSGSLNSADASETWVSENLSSSNLSEYDWDLSSPAQILTNDFISGNSFNTSTSASPSTSSVELYPRRVSSVRGVFVRDKFRGESHWSNYIYQSSKVLRVVNPSEMKIPTHGCTTLHSCNILAKALRIQERVVDTTIKSLQSLVPAREQSDRLVQAYLRTFQTVFGILHVPMFREEYNSFWNDPASSSDLFIVVLLLVMCIGSTFCSSGPEASRQIACQWFSAASTWLNGPGLRLQPNLETLRTRCLMVLAELARSVKTWKKCSSSGDLIRMAMQIGLHIDPIKHSLDHMTFSMVETRRRLWATVLELEIQTCMDSGEMISISAEDYDCESPLNIDDSTLLSGELGSPKPINQLTQSSIQVLLMKTMPARLNIVHFINKFQSSDSFEKTLTLSAELSAAVKSCTNYMDEYSMSSNPPTAFQSRFFDLLVQRFLLSLHHSFAVKARTDLSYYYSRKVCLDTALSLLAPSSHTRDDDFAQLKLHGAGPFRNVYRQCSLHLCGELIYQLGVDSALLADSGSTFARDEMLKATRKYTEMAVARLEAGDTKIKCYILVSCLLAQVGAMQTGASVEQRIAWVLQEKLDICYSILSKQSQRCNTRSLPEIQDARLNITSATIEPSNWSNWSNMMEYN